MLLIPKLTEPGACQVFQQQQVRDRAGNKIFLINKSHSNKDFNFIINL